MKRGSVMATSFLAGPRLAACALTAVLAPYFAPPGTLEAETLTLADCLRETAAHNPQIVEEQYGVEQATATRLTFRARALPTLNIGGILGYLGQRNTETLRVPVRDPVTGKTSDVTVTNARSGTELLIGTGELRQSIFDAAIPASWRRGNIGVTSAQEALYTVTAARLDQTRILFYQSLYQQEFGAVLRRLDEVSGAEIKTLDQLVTGGLAGRQSLLATKVQRTNFDTGIISNTGSTQLSLTALLQNMGRDLGPAARGRPSPTDNVRLVGLLEDRPLSFDAAAAAREALDHRPDIRSLRAMVRLENENANIARAGYYPLVQLYVAGELVPQSFVQRTDSNSVRQSDETQVTEVRPGVQESWTIVDTGQVRGTVRALEARRNEISVSLQAAERNLPSDFALVRAQITDAADKIAALRGNVDVAENTLTLVQGGLAQGINSQLEFFDAQSGVLGTRIGLLTAELEMSLAHAEFDRLTGRYLKFTPEEPVAMHKAPVRQ